MSLPARFRRSRLLIVGCGDVGSRLLPRVSRHQNVRVLTSSPGRCEALRAAGVTPLVGNLDAPASLKRLAALASRVLMLAPPPGQGTGDSRSRALAQALRRSRAVRRLVYASTTGVYGDAGGAWVDETRACAPQTDRARRRVAAEQAWRTAGRAAGWAVSILRVPGIYAGDREGGPAARVRRGAPVLRPEDDVYTNHIHAEDLARVCGLALFRGRPQRVYQVCDDSQRRMGEHFELVADACGLPRPPRISRAQAVAELSPVQMSFLSESRRLTNGRMKKELRLQLLYPDVLDALKAGR